MRYTIEISGLAPVIMHNGAAGLDTRSPAKKEIAEITAKRGTNRTSVDDDQLAQLETQVSLYLDGDNRPTLPEGALRAVIETGARKLKQGPMVREGLVVTGVEAFLYDEERYGTTPEELGKSAQFTVPVVVQRARVLRTRAKFDTWGCRFGVDVDEELVDEAVLRKWLEIGGSRIGIGDWRPEKSGIYGRFEVVSITEV